MPSSPAFQFYPADFLADENQMLMELAEAGAYIRLICVCWNEGSIPDDVRRLGKLVGTSPKEMGKIWPALAPCFEPHPATGGRLVHPRLERERRKQEAHRQKMSDAGRKGADAKHGKGTPEPGPSGGQAIAKPELGQPGASPAVPSSSSLSLASAGSSPTETAKSNSGGKLNVENSVEHTIGSVAMEAHRVLGMGTWGNELSDKFNATKATIRREWVAGGVSLESLYRAIHGLRLMVDGEEVEWLKDRKNKPLDGLHVLTREAVVAGPDGTRRGFLFQLAQEAYARDGPPSRTANSGLVPIAQLLKHVEGSSA